MIGELPCCLSMQTTVHHEAELESDPLWCDGAATIRTQWCGSWVVIHWTGGLHHESIATAAGRYASLCHAVMIAILKAVETVSEKLTDSAVAVMIHSDSRQALKQLVEGLALQGERAGCKIWGRLVATTERNTENVVHLIWVPGHAGV